MDSVDPLPLRTFSALAAVEGLRHCFVDRVPGIPVDCDKEQALSRLGPAHKKAAQSLGIGLQAPVWIGEQVHGDRIGVARDGTSHPGTLTPGLDGYVTDRAGVLLGVHVADCGAVYLVDPITRALGLLHAGRAGAEAGIVRKGIVLMENQFGSRADDILCVLSPCIRPPAYPFDLPGSISAQAVDAGIQADNYHDCGECTASSERSFYSYRREKGKTGRHLALIGWSDRE